MKFCVKCGKENKNNTNFCNFCGNKFDDVTKNNVEVKDVSKSEFSKNKNLQLAVKIILILVLIFAGYKFIGNGGNSKEKEEFLNTYEKAVKSTEKGNFIESKVELEKLLNKKSYNGIDVKKDIEMNVQLFGIRNFIKDDGYIYEEIGSKKIDELLTKFEKEFSGSKSEIYKISDKFRREAKMYGELLGEYATAEKHLESEDVDNANKELEKMKSHKFELPRIHDLASSKINSIESSITLAKKKKEDNAITKESNDYNNEIDKSNIDPLDRDYNLWSKELLPNSKVFKENGRWIVIDEEGMRYAVIYDFAGQVRLVNAQRNLHINY